MTDDFNHALETVIARTGIERYRWLCSEANTGPGGTPGEWRAWIDREAAREPGQPISVHYGDPPPAKPCGGCP